MLCDSSCVRMTISAFLCDVSNAIFLRQTRAWKCEQAKQWQISAFLCDLRNVILPASNPSLKVRTGKAMTKQRLSCWPRKHHIIFIFNCNCFCHVDEGNITYHFTTIFHDLRNAILPAPDSSLNVRTGEAITKQHLSCWQRKHHIVFNPILRDFCYVILPASDPSLKVRIGEAITKQDLSCWRMKHHTIFILIAIVFVMLTKETSHHFYL